MNNLGDAVIADARTLLRVDFLPKLERCVDALSEEDVWWRPNEASNSVGNLILHLNGSTRMWIVGVAADRPVTRDRAAEFAERGPIPKRELMDKLRATLAEVDSTLAEIDPGTMLEHRKSSRGEGTVLWAILHAVEHFSMHTGQIILLTKLRSKAAPHLSN